MLKKLKKSLNLGSKIAVRVPNGKCVLSILEKCKLLVGTSANISGQAPFSDPKKCSKNVLDVDVFVDGGKILSKGESTILEIEKSKVTIHRLGSLKKEEILEII